MKISFSITAAFSAWFLKLEFGLNKAKQDKKEIVE